MLTPNVAMSTGGLFAAATPFGGTWTSQEHPRGGGKEESGSSQAAGEGQLWSRCAMELRRRIRTCSRASPPHCPGLWGHQISYSTSAHPVLLNGISILAVRSKPEPGQGARQDVWPEMSRKDDAFGDPRAGSSPRHPSIQARGENPEGTSGTPAIAAPQYEGCEIETPSSSRTVRGWKELGDGSGWPLPAEGTVACLSSSVRLEPVPWDSSGGDIPVLLALVRT